LRACSFRFWLAALNQSCRKFEFLPQPNLFPCHGAMIALVVKTRQMQHPVQHKNLDLCRKRVAQPRSVPRSYISRDCDLSRTR